jgi:ABC-type nickel/cobalt efflux system permease component RcnA
VIAKELALLIPTAASIGLIHTVLGPDHYLPFIVMARARKWSLLKTAGITFLCGLGHIGSSVLLGLGGIVFGIAVTKLKFVESVRGSIAAWLLIAFGLVYFIWGLRRALRNRPHRHWHSHGDEGSHDHEHRHIENHTHVHERDGAVNLTPWILFTIFVFGPCEPLIPLVMYPAARHSSLGVVLVTAVFGGVTIATMLGVVLLSSLGVNLLPIGRLERYTHALAGAAILLCGVAIKFFGL